MNKVPDEMVIQVFFLIFEFLFQVLVVKLYCKSKYVASVEKYLFSEA